MKIILASHVTLASAMLETAKMFLGEVDNVDVLELQLGDSPLDFEDDMLAAAQNKQEGEQVLIICDLRSGTPFNTASKVSYQNDDIKVIYGMNLGLVLEAFGNRDDMDLEELSEYLMSLMPKTYGIGEF